MKKDYAFKSINLMAWALPLLLLFFAVDVQGQTTETFNGGVDVDWTVPCGVTSVTVKAWGAGGGGGGSDTNKDGGSGGGGGAYSTRVLAVTPGETIRYTVGASGGGGLEAGLTDGADGGDTVVTYGAFTITAGGGGGGAADEGAAGAGGTASGGTVDTSGSNGVVGGNDGGAGGNAANTAGGGGTGGAGGTSNNDPGVSGNSPGGGGGGGEGENGGDGGNGRVQFIYTPSAAEINITGNSVTIADGDATPSTSDNTDFGTGAQISKTFTIENSGGTALTVGAISFGGANAADFSVTSAPAASVACGESTTFTVRFIQGASGLRTATISIVNSDASENPYNFSIQATGVPAGPEMDIYGNGVAISSGDLTPSTADYTDFNGEGSRQFVIYNNGTTALSLSGTPIVSIGGVDAADFAISYSPDTSVSNASETTFVVSFAPSTLGTKNATISIANNDATENPYTFAITATSTAKEIDIRGDVTSIPDGNTAHSTTDLTDYQQVIIGSSWTNTFVIYNTGSLPLTLPANPVSSDNAKFTVIQPSSLTIPGYGAYEFYVTYTPTTAVTDSATITVLSDDADEGTYTFDLEGSGLAGTVLTQPGCLGGAAPQCEAVGNSDFDTSSAGWTLSNWSYDATGGNGGGGGVVFEGDNTNTKTGTITYPLSGLTAASTSLLISFDVRIAYNGCNPDYKYIDLGVRFDGVEYLTITRQVPGTVEAPLNLSNGGILVATSSSIFAGKEGGGGCDNALWYKVYLQVPKTAGDTAGNLSFYADQNNGKFANQLKMYLDNIEATADSGTCGFVWLKADAGTSTTVNGANISRWDDQILIDGGSAAELLTHPTQSVAGNQPNYETNVLNGNPGVYFDGSDYLTSTAEKSSSVSTFVVIKPAATINKSSASQTLLGSNITVNASDYSGIIVGNFSGSIVNEAYGILRGTTAAGWATGATNVSLGPSIVQIYPNSTSPATNWITKRNGVVETSTTGGSGYNQWAGQDYVIGASPNENNPPTAFSQYYTGHILEILNYPSDHSSTDKLKIESYLGTKYGISLGKSYRAGFGAITYNSNGGYSKRIFGIGREDCMEFHQREGTCESDTAESLMTIGYNSIISGTNSSASGNDLPNNAYVMIGDDNGARNSWKATDAPTTELSEARRIDRNFKLKVTGAPTSLIRFQVDGTKLPAVAADERIAIVIADVPTDIPNATLTGTQDKIVPMTKSGSDWFANLDVTPYSEAYFTFIRYEDCYTDLVCTGTTKTWNGASWSPSAPTVNDPVVISGAYNTSSGDFSCCTLQVDAALTIDDGGLVEVQSNIVNNSSITIENNGSLMQYYDGATNSGVGTITIRRDTQPMYRADYTYWSSPVTGFDISNIPTSQGNRYYYNASTESWAKASGTMSSGVGYIVMTDNTHATNSAVTSLTFSGTMYNGRVLPAIDNTGDAWNLLGNPYPSALDADDFITENHSTRGVTTGGLYFWTHNTRISEYNTETKGSFDQSDYAVYTLAGGVGTSDAGSFTTDVLDGGGADISYGGNSAVPNGFIAAGQAFFVKATATSTASFKNCMRTTSAGNNDNFYRKNNTDKKDRLWLNVVNKTGSVKQMLLGYFEGADDGIDGLYDAEMVSGTNLVEIYTMQENDEGKTLDFSIQGKSPQSFNENEVISIGFARRPNSDIESSISLHDFEGRFENMNIYLEDKLTQTIHDLKAGAYTFEESGEKVDDRFALRFNKISSKDELESQQSGVSVSSNDSGIAVRSTESNINKVVVYNGLGRTLFSQDSIDASDYSINALMPTNQMHIVVVYLNNGTKSTTKIIY